MKKLGSLGFYADDAKKLFFLNRTFRTAPEDGADARSRVHRLADGRPCYDEICTQLQRSSAEVDMLLRVDPNTVVVTK